jgi:hypothetical protein
VVGHQVGHFFCFPGAVGFQYPDAEFSRSRGGVLREQPIPGDPSFAERVPDR